MGLAWCRERIEQAQNSKSPVDRILVCCSNLIKPKQSYSHSQGKIVNDFVYRGMRNKNVEISPPVPVHAVPPRARKRMQKSIDWQTCTLRVPDSEDASKPPVPPPRKKRKPKLTSMEVLNSELPELNSPSYVIFSENLLNKTFANGDSAETNEIDVLHPLEKSYYTERTSVHDRFGKFSGNRTRKMKTGPRVNDTTKEKNAQNDNEKKAEQKIKHISTVSLPNYNELIKPSRKASTVLENGDDKTGNQSAGLKHPRRNSSTISLPGEGSNSILSSLSEATIHRLETYMKKCRSFGALKPQQLLEKLEEFNKTHRSASESSDSWSGLDDWDLGVIEYCGSETQAPPLTPKSTISSKPSKPNQNETTIQNQINANENKNNGEVTTAPKVEDMPSNRSSFYERTESVMERVPIEWFLNPSLRPPAIMPPPPAAEPQKYTKTPPPSPENNDDPSKNEENEPEEHSSLLSLLIRYKENESGEPEVTLDMNEILSDLESSELSGKDTLIFDEVDVKIPLSETLNPFLPLKNRSSSLALEEQARVLTEGKFKPRSPSIGFESSTHLLEQLQSRKEEIEKEILLKPNELIQGLRRESLCQSLPEDAFEAFVCKSKPSMVESLNDFLGFQDEKTPDPKNNENEEEKANNDLIKETNDEKESQSAPPLPVNPPPIVINPPPGEVTPVPHFLVNVNDNPNGI